MKTRVQRRKWRLTGLLLIISSYAAWALLRPLPNLLPPTTSARQQPATASQLEWPKVGQSAVGIVDSSILETNGTQTPLPIASTAKVITALVVLDQKPLDPSQSGPIITLTERDVALYHAYRAQHGSVVPVKAGEQITQYQVLQAIMLPSANNLSDTLAIWAFGSLEAYAAAANAYLKLKGLTSTTVGVDASGMSPSTTSTAKDLVKLGKLAMQEPVLAEIAGQSTAIGIPLTTTVKNVNFLLGTANVIGVKTGNTDEAGGVFISASKTTVDDKPVTIVTAFVGAPDLFTAVKGSLPLIQSAQANFTPVTLVKAGTAVGKYSLPWSGTITASAAKDLTFSSWNGKPVTARIKLNNLPPGTAVNHIAGTITAKDFLNKDHSEPIIIKQPASKPAIGWRLTHPLP